MTLAVPLKYIYCNTFQRSPTVTNKNKSIFCRKGLSENITEQYFYQIVYNIALIYIINYYESSS